MFGKGRPSAGTGRLSPVPDRTPHNLLPECNIALLGCKGAGKSEDTYNSEEIVDHQPVLLKIMDTADQEEPLNCERYLSWASAFIVIYSIDNRRSFEGCQRYLDIISIHTKSSPHEYPVILVGNKLDMERYRQVSKSDGLSLSSKHGCLFYEVSACLDFDSVQQVFYEAVREVRRENERNLQVRQLFITEEKPLIGLQTAATLSSKPSIATLSTLSTATYKEMPSIAQAKLVTVKASRAQSKRRAPTLTLLKGFKIF
ncbi:ras-like protein family member 12 isoform X2 [Protopterus annectens]|uniref:ras-like protein family member 12 isoform X2 n=1 Tax=Protopterus annectens TaxID=7888 RepID=UPI001CFA6311|nr:ras-like protein family member 12 isoform X2 [Protopterus annectens]